MECFPVLAVSLLALNFDARLLRLLINYRNLLSFSPYFVLFALSLPSLGSIFDNEETLIPSITCTFFFFNVLPYIVGPTYLFEILSSEERLVGGTCLA